MHYDSSEEKSDQIKGKYRQGARRKEKNDFEIFGMHPILEAIDAGKTIDRILIQRGLQGDLFKTLWDKIKERNINYQLVPIQKLNRLTKKNHQGVFAFISPVEYETTADVLMRVFESGETPLFVVLDRVTDVRNFGAIARTAECAGAQALIIADKGSARINSDALKTSAGALHRISVCKETSLKNLIHFLQNSGLQVIACTEKTDKLIYEENYDLPTALILGSEEDGISDAFLEQANSSVKIPMEGKTASLNVSVAAGLILYEAVRQRLK
ncbi:MAG: 23S rRNA (guanosine(2251)-2'-O)-methyltransferase RlmB [Flavobacteriales bacterium]